MENMIFGRKILSQLLVMMFILISCTPANMPNSVKSSQTGDIGNTTSGNGAGANDPNLGNGTSLLPKVEIRHLIEPNLSTDPNYKPGTGYGGGGSYVRKLTLPKNFSGRLYLAGINIGTLSNRFVKVRFKFGLGRTAITLPATVTQAPGITPQTSISVLVMDLRAEDFRDIRLPYALFDYNEYNFSNGDTPTQDNRDSGLYCRGLNVEDDPTFQGVGACDGLQSNPSQPAEECLYAFAQVEDQGLVQAAGATKVPLKPSLTQTKSDVGGSYYQDYLTKQLMKPLPDSMPLTAPYIAGDFKFSELAVPANSTDSKDITFQYPTSIWDPAKILGTDYYYRGPYRLMNTTLWQFKFPQLDGEKRLFRAGSWVEYPLYMSSPLPDDSQSYPIQDKLYYNSYLFPLATQLNLGANVSYLGSDEVLGERTLQTHTSGKTKWMDGSNARAESKNSDQEHIGSCNVSATIEVITYDDNNNEYIISLSNDVKLQLVRPTLIKTDTGNEVLYQNFKTCSSNSSCGGNECCFNNRCWDENLVTQCLDSSSTQGNLNIGASCTTDLECSSLCCNRTNGQCAPHNTVLSPPVLCSKPIGDYCIAKEWCQKSPVVKCLVVKTGTDTSGKPTCRQQCYTTQEFGDCKNGSCTPPVQEPIPPFDPNAPGACANAMPAPSF